MIGHQQFKNGFAGCQNLSGISFHFHSTFDGTNTGRGQNACSGVDHTQTANAHGSFILQMTQGGYRDAAVFERRRKHSFQEARTRLRHQGGC